MADLKANTTVGGRLVWTQGNFPLYPTGNTLFYNSYKVYTENDKPQATDNDFVSKQSGGTYQSQVTFNGGVALNAVGGLPTGIYAGNGDGATQAVANIDIRTWWGLGIYNVCPGSGIQGRSIWFDARYGDITAAGNIYSNKNVVSAYGPTQDSHVTRKDYVDNLSNQANINANGRVSRSGDSMTGNLSAPYLISRNPATVANHVPRLDQVITKGTIIDFGTF